MEASIKGACGAVFHPEEGSHLPLSRPHQVTPNDDHDYDDAEEVQLLLDNVGDA